MCVFIGVTIHTCISEYLCLHCVFLKKIISICLSILMHDHEGNIGNTLCEMHVY
jgi:hypothetical protein